VSAKDLMKSAKSKEVRFIQAKVRRPVVKKMNKDDFPTSPRLRKEANFVRTLRGVRK